MKLYRTSAALLGIILLAVFAAADSKPDAAPKLSDQGRVAIIRALGAELAFARTTFPQGRKGLSLKDGVISPSPQELQSLIATFGPAVKPGDRARITDIKFKDRSIVFEINGGPVKKKKWYERIQVSGAGGTVAPGQQQDDNANIHGSYVEVMFDKYVPNVTPDQVKELLTPVLNFNAKSAAEAYMDTVPPKVREAIKNHQVLVGMNREMVTYAKGRPPQKTREKDEKGADYEEWIYGKPPQEMEFVRFVGDEVVRLEIMKVDGEKVIRTEKEVDIKPPQPAVAEQQPPRPAGDQPAPAGKPTLRRPGEEAPPSDTSSGRTPLPPAPRPTSPDPGSPPK